MTEATTTTKERLAAKDAESAGHVSQPFEERYAEALRDPRLAHNLTVFQTAWREARATALGEVDFEALRQRLKSVKSDMIADLDSAVDQFQAAAEAAGATVHRAANADAANAIIRDLALKHRVNVVAKSKSMASEEIDLNHALLEAGIDAVETDLGEWIVQLRHERPSHMVMPAVHLARQQVASVLSAALHREVPDDDIAAQVAVARDELRKVFFAAGMGVTGANALVAETGTVMMVTNEGNGRLCSSVPPLHVVVAGIEKLVPTFADAVTQLRLLAKSATAQRITSYSTFITGPTAGHEMHIVLLDNGRRAMAAREEFREALHCIRCAACANVCPPYREVGGHVFGHVYTGAIGLVVTPFHHGVDAARGPQSLCLSCNACETVCPVGIPLPRQIIDVRKMVVQSKGLPLAKRVVLNVYARPRAVDVVSRIGSRAQRPLTRRSRFIRARRLPVLRRQTRWRSMPALARRPLRDRLARLDQTAGSDVVIASRAAGLTVGLFPGCITDRVYPEQGEAIVTVLRALGVKVIFPKGLNCCGLPANNSGDEPHARSMAKQTIQVLEQIEVDYIVSGSASCVATLTQDYGHLFRNELEWRARAEAVASRVRDFTSFLTGVAELADGALATNEPQPVAYHDSCQGLNALGLRAEPRRLLRDVLGCELRELDESTLCCGFGGSFSFEYPEVASRLMDRKLDDAERTQAPVLVTDNQGCILHLRGGCDAANRPLKVWHLAEIVADRIQQRAARSDS